MQVHYGSALCRSGRPAWHPSKGIKETTCTVWGNLCRDVGAAVQEGDDGGLWAAVGSEPGHSRQGSSVLGEAPPRPPHGRGGAAQVKREGEAGRPLPKDAGMHYSCTHATVPCCISMHDGERWVFLFMSLQTDAWVKSMHGALANAYAADLPRLRAEGVVHIDAPLCEVNPYKDVFNTVQRLVKGVKGER